MARESHATVVALGASNDDRTNYEINTGYVFFLPWGWSRLAARGGGGHGHIARPPVKVSAADRQRLSGSQGQETTPVFRDQLAKDTRFSIQVVDDLKFLRSQELHKFAAIVIHFKNYDPAVPGPEGQENLARFVRQGGGAVLVHFACGAFQEWPESCSWLDASGIRNCGHDPHGTFQWTWSIEPSDTQGFPAFEVDRRVVYVPGWRSANHGARHGGPKVDQKTYPMAFVLPYGQGRVFQGPRPQRETFSTPAWGNCSAAPGWRPDCPRLPKPLPAHGRRPERAEDCQNAESHVRPAGRARFARSFVHLVQAWSKPAGRVATAGQGLADRDLVERARVLRRLTRGTATLIVSTGPTLPCCPSGGVHVGQDE